METKTILKFVVKEDHLEVVGYGTVPAYPLQVGEWWVMPAEQYEGKIPPEATLKLCSLINQGYKIKGVLVADDFQKVKEKKEKEQQKEERKKQLQVGTATAAKATVGVLGALAMGLVLILTMGLAYDPILIACLDDGSERWVCCGKWFD
jgi:hypothetical protein